MRPDAAPFGFPTRFWESLFGVFEASWGAFWASRGSLGSLLEPLGAILGRLGAKLCGLGATFGALDLFIFFFGAILGAKRVPKGRHFGSQNGAKIDQKKRCKFKSEKVTSWSRLGAILDRFARRLGVKNIDFSLVFKGFREHRNF